MAMKKLGKKMPGGVRKPKKGKKEGEYKNK